MTGKESPPPPQSENAQYSAQSSEEGMSFIDFMEVLIRKKGLIFLIAATSTLLSIGYALSVTPVYKASIGFLPPKNIIVPESFPLEIIKETNTSLYKKFLARLQSYNYREKVFKSGNFIEKFEDKKRGPTTPENLFLQLNSSISLKENILEKNRSFDKPLYLQMLGPKPEAMADFLNSLPQAAVKDIQTETIDQLLKLIEEKTRKRIANLEEKTRKRIASLTAKLQIHYTINIIDNNSKHAISGAGQPKWFLFGQKALIEEINQLQIKMSDITRQVILEMLGPKPEAMADFLNSLSQAAVIDIQTETINQLLKLIEEKTLERIANLEEETRKRIANLTAELQIARKLNIIDNNFKHAISLKGQPKWFLFGQKALIEEINQLQIKMSDITRQVLSDNLKSAIDVDGNNQILKAANLTQSESEKIKTYDWAQIKIEVASVSQPSVPPSKPVKPRKPLIISIGILMGLFLGVILAFLRDAMENLGRKKEASR